MFDMPLSKCSSSPWNGSIGMFVHSLHQDWNEDDAYRMLSYQLHESRNYDRPLLPLYSIVDDPWYMPRILEVHQISAHRSLQRLDILQSFPDFPSPLALETTRGVLNGKFDAFISYASFEEMIVTLHSLILSSTLGAFLLLADACHRVHFLQVERSRGGIKETIRKTLAPMFQFELDTVLFTFTVNVPRFVPLLTLLPK